ncbi:TRAP-type C4-dicarboxylate transport system substrate-binding protein [Rhodobacteraceae bacterium MBR-64]|jgi:TRAP-type C4-dicarboxylate transport system substrate-binding protein
MTFSIGRALAAPFRGIALALGGLALLSSAASAQPTAENPVVMRLSHPYPTVTQHHDNMKYFKEEVEKRTGGRLIVDIFPASQLMPITQEINGMLSGQIDAAYSLNTIAATLDPLWGFFELPFLFNITPSDQKHLRDFVKSEAGGGALRASMEAKGLKVLAIAPTDMVGAFINTRHPVRTIEDFAGLKMRIPGGKYLGQSINLLGASSISMAYAEFSSAIVQGTVDGTVTGILFTYDNRIPIKYLSGVNLWYAGLPLLVSKRFFDTLPEDIQQVLVEAGSDLEDYGFDATERRAADVLKRIETEMDVEVEPPFDDATIQPMREATQPVLEAFVNANPAGQALIDEAERLRPN